MCLLLLILVFTNILAVGQTRKCYKTSSGGVIRTLRSQYGKDDPVLYVPVVIHVVYSTEEQNISYTQILSQLDALNQDFRRTNADTVNTLPSFKSLGADAKIEFFLPDVGNSRERGVLRIPTSHAPFAGAAIHYSDTGGSNAMDTRQFLNIWVAELAGEVFGYSNNSLISSTAEEGIVIDYRYFGTIGTTSPPFDKGRTLTHEIGHWLGLAHPWSSDGCGDGDGIADTPWQEKPSFGCDLNKESCGSLDMVQNFMDLSEDACMNLFTTGQVSVMRNTLLTYKAGLVREEILLTASQVALDTKFTIYPNPTHGSFMILYGLSSSARILSMADSSGKKIGFSAYYENDMIRIEPAGGMTGLFFLEMEFNSVYVTKRVILN